MSYKILGSNQTSGGKLRTRGLYDDFLFLLQFYCNLKSLVCNKRYLWGGLKKKRKMSYIFYSGGVGYIPLLLLLTPTFS